MVFPFFSGLVGFVLFFSSSLIQLPLRSSGQDDPFRDGSGPCSIPGGGVFHCLILLLVFVLFFFIACPVRMWCPVSFASEFVLVHLLVICFFFFLLAVSFHRSVFLFLSLFLLCIPVCDVLLFPLLLVCFIVVCEDLVS